MLHTTPAQKKAHQVKDSKMQQGLKTTKNDGQQYETTVIHCTESFTATNFSTWVAFSTYCTTYVIQLTTYLIAKGNKLPASKLNVRCKLSNLLLRRSSVDSSTTNSSGDLVSYKSFLQELSLLKAQETYLVSDNPF